MKRYKQCPGLAIQEAWNLPQPERWEVIHVASGRIIAKLLTKDNAQACLELLSKLLDWTQPAESIVPAEEDKRRHLLAAIANIAAQFSGKSTPIA